MTENLTRTLIKVRVVGIDVTDNYFLDPGDEADIIKIVDVFLYDEARATYCCELTPSFYLEYQYTNIEFAERFYGDVETEEIARRKDELYQKYAYVPTDNCYMHCSDVKDSQWEGDFPYRDDDDASEEFPQLDTYVETFDAIAENVRGNPPI
jgi:hypothetical protein